jgi:hypothetical protein
MYAVSVLLELVTYFAKVPPTKQEVITARTAIMAAT